MEEKKLVPAHAVHFPGSFAPDLREDHRRAPETRHWRSRVYTYFTDGWVEISIWKSAVSNTIALATFLPFSTGDIIVLPSDSVPVHRIRRLNVPLLSLRYDSCHDW